MSSRAAGAQLIWLSHFIPFPPRGGAFQRSYHLLREASRHHEIILVAFNRPAVPAGVLRSYDAELRSFCAVVEFWDLPFPWHGARWWAGLLSNWAQALPFSCEAYRSTPLLRRWIEILEAYPDALVHLDSSDLAAFAPVLTSRRVLLNHHNCESAMAERRARAERNPLKKLLLAAQAKKQARLERRLCPQVSVNAVVSAEDGDSLRRLAPDARVQVVANGTDTDYFTPNPEAIRANTLVFVGTLDWYPNVSALRYFRRGIWPRLKAALPGLEFVVVGQSPVEEIAAWAAEDDAVTLVDSPADVRPWLDQGAVFVCPIIDGGGTRLKLLDAMSAGKAIVTTSIGSEGLGIDNGRQALIADTEDAFVEAVLHVLGDRDVSRSLAREGREFVEQRFSWKTIGEELETAYSHTAHNDR